MRRLIDNFTLIALMMLMSFLQQLDVPAFTGFMLMIGYWILFWWWFDSAYVHVSQIKVKNDADNSSDSN